jgi:glycosyltransferase involved in cell wall biosynthesis
VKLLFVHQNCPGQFKHLAPRLAADPGNEVVFLTQRGKPDIPNVRKLEYEPSLGKSKTTHRYLRLTEEGIRNGQAAARIALKLRDEGFFPDAVVAHMGWGEALYLKAVWPQIRLLGYFEWYYNPTGADVGFDPDNPATLDDVCRISTRNCLHLLNLQTADWGFSPTSWQWSQHPREYRSKLSVIHEGVDVDHLIPNPDSAIRVHDNLHLHAGSEIVTYVARNLEPYRGFPTFIRAAEMILQRRRQVHIIVVGGDDVSYGSKRKDGKSYRDHYMENLDLDLSRIHFLGRVPYSTYVRVLQVSAVHVYLTVPFVLSWSMLEAMAAGCLVLGSRTPPVEEVIKDGHNGLLVDFFSPEAVANRVDSVLDHPNRMQRVRDEARQTIKQRYGLDLCLNKQVKLIQRVVKGIGSSEKSIGREAKRRQGVKKKHGRNKR